MKKQKHFFLYLIVPLLFLVLYTNCENKRDDSGTLGGMWQLVEWRNIDGSLAYDKPDTNIYYKIRSNLLMFQELPGEEYRYFLTYYHQTADSFIIDQPYKIVKDVELNKTLYPIEVLRRYGIPANGRLHIDVLNSDKMVLSGEEGSLRFRKY